MRFISGRAWALIVLSALLQVAMFPVAGPLPVWRTALGWVALVPLLVALLRETRTAGAGRVRNAALLGYGCGICWYMGNCYWIYQTMHLYGGMPEPVAFVILILFALYLGLYHAFFGALVGWLGASKVGVRGALLFSPFVWVSVELARARITFFPWDLLGYSQVDNLLLTRLAPVAGVMSISFVLAAGNAAVASYFFLPAKRKFAIPAIGLVAAALLQLTGQHVAPDRGIEKQPAGIAVMMQENIEVGAVGKAAGELGLADEVTQFSGWSLHPVAQNSASGTVTWSDTEPYRTALPAVPGGEPAVQATLIIWPEAPSHLFSQDAFFRAAMARMAQSAQAPAIIGSLGVDFSNIPQRGYYRFDSASIFHADGEYVGRYDKIHLVPWGEFIPFKEFFSFAAKLTEGAGDMDRGTKRDPFSLSGHSYGVFVCYESIFGDEVRQFVRNGAEVLVNISDDGWYGDSGAPWQHLNMARMRAIENHRWILRDTNTGITTAIDPSGQIAIEAPRHTRAAFAFPFGFEPAGETTVYTRHGDWFAWLCALLTIGGVIWYRPLRARNMP